MSSLLLSTQFMSLVSFCTPWKPVAWIGLNVKHHWLSANVCLLSKLTLQEFKMNVNIYHWRSLASLRIKASLLDGNFSYLSSFVSDMLIYWETLKLKRVCLTNTNSNQYKYVHPYRKIFPRNNKNKLIENGTRHLHCLDLVDSKNLSSIHLISISQFTSLCHNYLSSKVQHNEIIIRKKELACSNSTRKALEPYVEFVQNNSVCVFYSYENLTFAMLPG